MRRTLALRHYPCATAAPTLLRGEVYRYPERYLPWRFVSRVGRKSFVTA